MDFLQEQKRPFHKNEAFQIWCTQEGNSRGFGEATLCAAIAAPSSAW